MMFAKRGFFIPDGSRCCSKHIFKRKLKREAFLKVQGHISDTISCRRSNCNEPEQYLNGDNLFRPNINQLPNNQQQQAATYYRAGAEKTNDPLIPIRTSGNGLYSRTHSEHGNSGWYSNHQSGGGQAGLQINTATTTIVV
ncbi:unnamed protein product [Didymodactylos carnosus]|uniref:Uncharacterized protein n=2 Tax=Didymodactylos carnosus TaxID=1234261 RepID=A0A815CYT2_9BILA|nr:unnamed protein product [Didymodactylos carnosus]CAF4096578.1 unnamed protein product [Didymodactylos carnosus]